MTGRMLTKVSLPPLPPSTLRLLAQKRSYKGPLNKASVQGLTPIDTPSTPLPMHRPASLGSPHQHPSWLCGPGVGNGTRWQTTLSWVQTYEAKQPVETWPRESTCIPRVLNTATLESQRARQLSESFRYYFRYFARLCPTFVLTSARKSRCSSSSSAARR